MSTEAASQVMGVRSVGAVPRTSRVYGSATLRRRGCRAGRRVQQHRLAGCDRAPQPPVSVLVSSRHTAASLVLSLHNKTDDVVEIMRVNVFCLTETWHDADSV